MPGAFPNKFEQLLRNARKLGFWTGKNAGRFAKTASAYADKNKIIAAGVLGAAGLGVGLGINKARSRGRNRAGLVDPRPRKINPFAKY